MCVSPASLENPNTVTKQIKQPLLCTAEPRRKENLARYQLLRKIREGRLYVQKALHHLLRA